MRRAEPIAALGGLLLLVSLFLPWGGVAVITRGSNDSDSTNWLTTESGWQTLTVIDVLLTVLALLALLVPITSLAATGAAKPIAVALLGSALGWLAPVLVAVKLIGGDLRYGAWLALAGAIIAWVGSWLSLRDESTPGAVAPDVPLRALPPA